MNKETRTSNSPVFLRVSVCVLAVLLFACTVFIGVLTSGYRNWQGLTSPISKTAEQTPASEMPNKETSDIRAVSLSMNTAVMNADSSISKTLTASIYPADAKNKALDWALEWMDETNTANITDFLSLTPESDGSLTAVLTCYKPFEGEALITATSRDGNVFDTCRAVFVGLPSSLNLQPQGFSPTSGTIGSYYELGVDNSYTFDITPSNVFGQVGANCNYTYEVSAVGSIKVQDVLYKGLSDTYEWKDGTENTLNLSSITTVSKYEPSIYDCSVSGNKLTITINCTPESYYQDSKRTGQNVNYTQRFRDYSNDNWYYELKVTETTSDVSKTFKFRPVKTVTSVMLADDVVTF